MSVLRIARIHSIALWVAGAVATGVLAGCGAAEEGPQLAPVSGRVLVDGNPLAGAGISFRPDVSKGNTAPYMPAGTADGEGKYELITAAKKGAPAGWYKVVIVPPVPPMTGGEAPQVGPPPFNPKYANSELTDLMVEVKAGEPTSEYDLVLSK